MKYYQGRFSPRNKQKYNGDVFKIFYRSSWELAFMCQLDKDPLVLEWSSEENRIPYISIDNKRHMYYPDFKVKYSDNRGTMLIEIKPAAQVSKPKEPKRITKAYLNKVATWVKNQRKWEAANDYATSRGMTFKLLTEKELGIL